MNIADDTELSAHFNRMTFMLYAFYLKKEKKSCTLVLLPEVLKCW